MFVSQTMNQVVLRIKPLKIVSGTTRSGRPQPPAQNLTDLGNLGGARQAQALLRGWSQYFNYGSLAKAYGLVNHHVEERVRHFLRRRHKVRQGAIRRWPKEEIFGPLGVTLLQRPPLA